MPKCAHYKEELSTIEKNICFFPLRKCNKLSISWCWQAPQNTHWISRANLVWAQQLALGSFLPNGHWHLELQMFSVLQHRKMLLFAGRGDWLTTVIQTVESNIFFFKPSTHRHTDTHIWVLGGQHRTLVLKQISRTESLMYLTWLKYFSESICKRHSRYSQYTDKAGSPRGPNRAVVLSLPNAVIL